MRSISVLWFVVMLLMTGPSFAQKSAATPMDVARLATLKAASLNDQSGWAKVAYQEYANGLIDGLMDREGDKFCLPKNIRAAQADIIFSQMTADLEESVKDALPRDLVAVAMRKFLARKYPCNG
jgi:hypothetical protein